MLRALLISDTHGDLDKINELAKKTQASMVIHAGDFGFYEETGVTRLSTRELTLLIVHSPFRHLMPSKPKREELVDIVLGNRLQGNFPDYLSGKKRFEVPVYAVWGNHEDIAVIEKIRKNGLIENLQILDENHCYDITYGREKVFQLLGIGGNFLPGKKLFKAHLLGSGGKVWSTLHQFGTLYQQLIKKNYPRIFVSHVSPGKESLLANLITHFQADFWISGHMGAPYTAVWNQFTVREEEDAQQWLKATEFLKELSIQHSLTEETRLALNLFYKPLSDKKYWLKHPWNINLPDAKEGNAVLCVEKGRFSLETFSKGLLLGNSSS